jgi:phosphoglycerate kinase
MRLVNKTDLKNKTVLLRVDFNLPMDQGGNIIDDNRVMEAIPTIKYILNSDIKKLILISHLGRPVIRNKEIVSRIVSGNAGLIMKPIAERLCKILKLDDKIEEVDIDFDLGLYKLSDKLFLMENIRFIDGEQKCDPVFCKKLASLGDIFVFDAFATAHHASCSVSGLSKFLPTYAGFLVKKEMEHLDKIVSKLHKPFVVVLGGAKISDKILVMKNLIKKADYFLLGGVMANTFLASRGIDMKNSIVEKDRINIAEGLMREAAKKIILPVDLIWNRDKVVDLGKETIRQFARYISKAQMIFINGTMGLTSMGMDKYAVGTREVLKLISDNSDAITIASGGDTVAEVDKAKLAGKFSYVSTGGGATLEFLAGKKLPGLEALK